MEDEDEAGKLPTFTPINGESLEAASESGKAPASQTTSVEVVSSVQKHDDSVDESSMFDESGIAPDADVSTSSLGDSVNESTKAAENGELNTADADDVRNASLRDISVADWCSWKRANNYDLTVCSSTPT